MKKRNRLRGFLKTIETIFYKNFRIYDGNYLKQASSKRANIHNRWLSCRRQRSLRSHE